MTQTTIDEDRHLARLAAAGDAQAIRSLYDRHRERIYGLIRRMAGDDAVADDWSQEAWLRVFRALPRYRGDSLFGTWAYRIAVNVALNGRRKRGREAARVIAIDGVEAVGTVDRPLLRLDLRSALDRLPDGMRTVLVLHDVEGFTHEEIGERLGVSPGTSKSQLFKARAKVRAMLDARSESEAGANTCNT